MANNRFNKQVTPKGYKMGGRAKKMGGGMMMQRPMMQRPMMEKGGRTKKMTEAQKQAAKKTGKKVMRVAKTIGKIVIPGGMAVDTGVKLAKRLGKKMGGSLKPVDPKTQKGLSKLPTEVRNKMGYMKKGGLAKLNPGLKAFMKKKMAKKK